MNLVPCSENCRWQSDGMCTLKDLTLPANSAGSECRYFEKTDIQPCGNSAEAGTRHIGCRNRNRASEAVPEALFFMDSLCRRIS